MNSLMVQTPYSHNNLLPSLYQFYHTQLPHFAHHKSLFQELFDLSDPNGEKQYFQAEIPKKYLIPQLYIRIILCA